MKWANIITSHNTRICFIFLLPLPALSHFLLSRTINAITKPSFLIFVSLLGTSSQNRRNTIKATIWEWQERLHLGETKEIIDWINQRMRRKEKDKRDCVCAPTGEQVRESLCHSMTFIAIILIVIATRNRNSILSKKQESWELKRMTSRKDKSTGDCELRYLFNYVGYGERQTSLPDSESRRVGSAPITICEMKLAFFSKKSILLWGNVLYPWEKKENAHGYDCINRKLKSNYQLQCARATPCRLPTCYLIGIKILVGAFNVAETFFSELFTYTVFARVGK